MNHTASATAAPAPLLIQWRQQCLAPWRKLLIDGVQHEAYPRDADRERGRFCSFLLTSVKHFLANESDKANALKRGGGRIMLSACPENGAILQD